MVPHLLHHFFSAPYKESADWREPLEYYCSRRLSLLVAKIILLFAETIILLFAKTILLFAKTILLSAKTILFRSCALPPTFFQKWRK